MQAVPLEPKVEMTVPYLEKAGWIATPADTPTLERVEKTVAAAGDRIKVAGDILDYGEFFVADGELEYDEKAFQKRLARAEGAAALLREFRAVLADLDPWETDRLESAMRTFVESRDLKLGAIIHAVRVATTGKAVGFGMFETLEILGKPRTLARIDQTLPRL